MGSKVIRYPGDWKCQWDVQDITKSPVLPIAIWLYEVQTHIANVYSTCMGGCLTHIISKTELLIFFSNTFFGRLFQVLRPKYYSLSMTVYLSSHLLVNPSAHTISYFSNIQISIIKYWWNKHSESLLTTFYHIYCHHHGPSLRYLWLL